MARHTIRVGTQGGILPPIENVIKNAQRNEEQGFDSLWWPDHLMGLVPESIWTPDIVELARYQRGPHVYLDVVAAMAAVGLSTDKIRLATGVTEAIRRHPAMLAQSFLTLDHISKGRVILGLGSGEKENITPYGLELSRPVGRLEEAIRIVKLLWSTDQPVDFDGTFWRLKDAVLGLRPYGQKPPPIWMGAMGPRMLEICGKFCDGWLPTRQSPEEYGRKLSLIKRIGVNSGRDMSDFTASMNMFCVIDRSHEESHRLLESTIFKAISLFASADVYARHGYEHPLGARYDATQEYVPTTFGRQEALALVARVPFEVVHDYVTHGTPDEICELLDQYAEQGLQHVSLHNLTVMADMSKLKPSFEGLVEILKSFS